MAIVTSTFDGSENPLSESGAWAAITNWGEVEKVSGYASATTKNVDSARKRASSGIGSNQYCEIVTTAQSLTQNMFAGAACRIQSDGSCYLFTVQHKSNGLGDWNLDYVDNTFTFNHIEQGTTGSFAFGQPIRIECDGTTITGWINGTKVTADNTHSTLSGGDPGIQLYNQPNDTTAVKIDSFEAGDLSTAVDVTKTMASGSAVKGGPTATNASGSSIRESPTLTKPSGTDVSTEPTLTRSSGSAVNDSPTDIVASGVTVIGDATTSKSSGASVMESITTSKASGSAVSESPTVSKSSGSSVNQSPTLTKASGVAVSGGSQISSSFDGSEDPLSEGGNWTTPGTWTGLKKVSGVVRVKNNADDCFARWTGTSIGDDYSAEIEIAEDVSGLLRWMGICARSQTDGSCYVAMADPENGRFRITKVTAPSTFNTLEETTGLTIGLGDKIKIEVSGANPCTIKGYLDTGSGYSQIGSDQTDSDYDAGPPQLFLYNNSSIESRAALDNFLATGSGGAVDQTKSIASGSAVTGDATDTIASGSSIQGDATDTISSGSSVREGITSSKASGSAVTGDATDTSASGSSVKEEVTASKASGSSVLESPTATKTSGSAVNQDVADTVASGSSVNQDVTGTISSGSSVLETPTLTKASGADVQSAGDVSISKSSGSSVLEETTASIASGSAIVSDKTATKSSGSTIAGDASTSKSSGSSVDQENTFSRQSGAAVQESGSTVSSTFDDPPESPLSEGGDWTTATGWSNAQKSGGFARPTVATDDALARWTGTDIGSNEQEVTVKLYLSGTPPTFAHVIGACARLQADGTGYAVRAILHNDLIRISRITGVESFTNLQEISGVSLVDGDDVTIKVVGSTIQAFVNGSQIGSDQTDSTHASGDPGVLVYGYAASEFGQFGVTEFNAGPADFQADKTHTSPSGASVNQSPTLSMASGAQVDDGSPTISMSSGSAITGDATVSMSSGAAVQAEETFADHVTQYGVTWNFDTDYAVGQFVNGDWWVKENTPGGGVSVVSTSPAQIYTGTISSLRNGSMLNPLPDDGTLYDGRTERSQYNDNPIVSFPVSMNALDSLCSSISNPETGTITNITGKVNSVSSGAYKQPTKTVAVLTCVASTPAATSFRPHYAGDGSALTKVFYDAGDINWSKLPELTHQGGDPYFPRPPGTSGYASTPIDGYTEVDYFARQVQRPWVLHATDYTGRSSHPSDSMAQYHAEVSTCASDAMMVACMQSAEDKTDLIYGIIQIAIDSAGVIKERVGLGRAPDSSVYYPLVVFGGHLIGSQAILDSVSTWGNAHIESETYDIPVEAETTVSSSYSGGVIPPTGTWRSNGSFRYGYVHNGTDPDMEIEHLHPTEWYQVAEKKKSESYRRQNTKIWVQGWCVLRVLNLINYITDALISDQYFQSWLDDGTTYDQAVIDAGYGASVNLGAGGSKKSALGGNFVDAYWDTVYGALQFGSGCAVKDSPVISKASGCDVQGGGTVDQTKSVPAGSSVTGDVTNSVASGSALLESPTISKFGGAATIESPTLSKASGAEVVGTGEALTTIPSGTSVLDDAVTASKSGGASVQESPTDVRASGSAVQESPTHSRQSGSTVVGDSIDTLPSGSSVKEPLTTSKSGGSSVQDSPTHSRSSGSAITSPESLSKASGAEVQGLGDVMTTFPSGASITGEAATSAPSGASLLDVFQSQLSSGAAIQSDQSVQKASGAEVILPDQRLATFDSGTSVESDDLVTVGCGSSITDAPSAQFASGAAVGYKNEPGINRGWHGQRRRGWFGALLRGWRGGSW